MFRHIKYFLFTGTLIVTACRAAQASASPTAFASPTQTIVAFTTATQSVSPVATRRIATPTLASLTCIKSKGDLPRIPSGKYEGWCKYTDDIYGFSLAIPPGWELAISLEPFIHLYPQSMPTLVLTIGYKQAAEEVPIQRTGVGAGEVVSQGTVHFFGQKLSRNVLLYENKVKAVLYNNALEIHTDPLIFTLSLDDWSGDYEAVSLSPEIQETADGIVESFEWK